MLLPSRRLQQQRHDAVERAEPARHVAGQRHQLGRQEGAQHDRVGRRVRQQDIQDAGGEHPVGHRHQQLGQRERQRRYPHIEAAHPQRRRAHQRQQQIRAHQRQAGQAEPLRAASRQFAWQPGMRVIDEASAAQREQAEPISDAVHGHDPRQVGAGHAPARIEAVAHGRSRQEREADAVADRIADEGGVSAMRVRAMRLPM